MFFACCLTLSQRELTLSYYYYFVIINICIVFIGVMHSISQVTREEERGSEKDQTKKTQQRNKFNS